MDIHIHDYEYDTQKCRWCGEPRLNGTWPTNTWFKRRLAAVRLAQLQEEGQNHEQR